MKKTYNNPTINVIIIGTTHQMLAGSDKVTFSNDGATGSGQLIQSGASSAGLGRGGWFDEGEE